MNHSYLRDGQLVAKVPQGFPHGDAWGQTIHPDAPPTHDVERHLKKLEELAKKGKK